MEMVWTLHGDVLARLRHTLKPYTSANGADDPQARVSLEAFVTGVYRVLYLECSPEDRSGAVNAKSLLQIRHLAERMCILFDLVDVDNAGVVDWVDFTDFCVHIRGGGMIGHRNGRGASHGGERDQQEDTPRYSQNLSYTDRGSHCQEIRGMRFAEKLGLLAVVDGTHVLKIYAAGPQRVAQIEPAIEMAKTISDKTQSAQERSLSNRKARREGAQKTASMMTTAKTCKETMAVHAVEFIGSESQIAVSCADGFLTIWELKTSKILRYTRMKSVQMGLRFCSTMNVLASWGIGHSNHDILVWDVNTLKVIHILSGHSGPIKDVCEVASGSANGAPFNTMIVTAGMDSKVITWDLWLDPDRGKRVPKKAFILTEHKHGVLSLAYSDEHELIISAGFDVRANCWDRCSNHIRMRLVGHRVSLIGVAIVRQEAQRAITGDEGGNFRLWDIRRGPYDHGTCLQIFSLDNARAMPRTMVIAWREDLIAADSKLYVFQAGRHVAARVTPRGAWFSPYTGELCVLLNEAVVLDGRTGEVLRRICRQTRGREITAFCLDSCGKKAVIGDQRGDLRVYDAVTGRWAISAVPHRAQVAALLFVDEDGAFISAGWDRKIQVHDVRVCSGRRARGWTQQSRVTLSSENTSCGRRRAGVLRSVEDAHDGDITLMAASFRLGLLVTASTDLTIRVWDYKLLRLEDVIIGHRREISCVCFLDPLPCLATADMAGKILLWAIGPPYDKATVLLATIRNTVVVVKHIIVPSPITALAFLYNKDAPAEPTVPEVKEAGSPRKGDKDMVVEPRPSAQTSGGSRNGKSPSTQMRSTLFVGDEVGSIKAWDVTNILLEKLGPTAYGLGSTVDKAMIPPKAGGKSSHQFVHHRRGPLHGVGTQSALRLRKLIEIAKVLRTGDYAPSTTELPGAGCEKAHSSSGADPNDDRKSTRNSTLWHTRPHSRGQFANVPREGTHDLAVSLLNQDNDPHAENQFGGRSTKFHRFSASEDEKTCRQDTGQQEDPREQVEAVLNIQVDNFDPVASWRGHTDAVTSIQAICSPPSLLTGSLDGSVRIFDLDGSLLGVVIHENEPGSAPWLFGPPTTGREAEARERAVGLVEKLRALRQIRLDSLHRQDTAGDREISADSRVLSADNELRGLVPVSGSTETNPIVSATNLSKVEEVRQSRVTVMPDDFEKGTFTDQQRIGAGLKDKAVGRKTYQPAMDEEPRSTSLAQRGRYRLGEGTVRNPPRIVKEKFLDPRKTVPNFYMEQQRKHVKRTRSTLQFLSLSLNRTESLASAVGCLRPSTAPLLRKKATRAPVELSQGQADSSIRPRTAPPKRSEKAKDWSRKDEMHLGLIPVCSAGAFPSTSSHRDEGTPLAPTRTLRLVDEAASELLLRSKASKQTLGHRRSAMKLWLASARSNLSLKDELAKRRMAERRRRRIDCILNKVCQLGNDKFPTPPVSSGKDDGSRAPGTTASQAWADAGEGVRRPRGATTFSTSTRVRQVLSRFESCVSEDVGNRNVLTSAPGRQTQNDGYDNSGNRKQDNSSEEASRHSRQHLRAKRLDRVSPQKKAHQNRQEVTVGLNRPSCERFGMYNLHEVLEFQTFAQFLSSQGANHLTIQELLDNPGVQANPRHYAFLQEARTRVISLNQALSQEDLMEVVFHSAKREEIRRMISVMDIANMLQRIRDTFVVAKDSLLSDDGALSHCLANDVETITRQTANSEICTSRELHGIMTWVGSDLFSLGEEEFEALSAQCDVLDMNKALTAGEITAIITKLASLHHRQG